MRTNRRWQGRSSFTLIELVTVIVILGIMAAAVGGPTMTYIDSMRSRAAAARVTADIRFMQRMALSSGLRTWVVFNAGSDSYQLYTEDPTNLGKANRQAVKHPFNQTTAAVQFGSGEYTNVSLTSVNINATGELEFDNFGLPYDGNGVALTATGTVSLSSGASVTIYPVSGFVERAG